MNAIVEEVAQRGRVSFKEFMELALYHPRLGYYTRPRRGAGPAGEAGDFLTAPTASPLLAATFAQLIARLAQGVGGGVTLVELGAGEGFFVAAVAAAAPAHALERIVAVERASWARRRLARRCARAEVVAELDEAARPAGPVLLFASELYDAVPVHRVTMVRRGEQLLVQEFYVEVGGGGTLRWVLDEPSSPEVGRYLHEAGIVLEEDQIAEIRPTLRELHARHLCWCGPDALAVILDYGHPGRRLYDPRARKHGSLVGYRGHRLERDVLVEPGFVDITAHVNFDDLEGAAAEVGWERGELRPLGLFLALHGAVELLPSGREGPLSSSEWAALSAAKRLLMPSGMGSDLKVLTQGRGRMWRHYVHLATPPPIDA